MARKKILLLLSLCCCWWTMTAQLPQRQTVSSEPTRANSVYLGVSGGMSKHYLILSYKTERFTGAFGQVDAFVFLTENITVGANFAYHRGFGNKKHVDFDMAEVLISGAYYFKSSWNPNVSFGLGYFEDYVPHFGMVPAIGIMPKIAKNVYFKAKGSVVFYDMGGRFFKIEAGFAFKVFQHKPVKR